MSLVDGRRSVGVPVPDGQAPGGPAPGTRDRRLVAAGTLAAAAAAVVVLAVAAARGGAARPDALADPGAVTRWGLLAGRAAYDLSAMATVGVLTVAVVLLPSSGGALSPDASRLVRLSTRWSAAWLSAALVGALLTLSQATGSPVQDVLAADVLPLALDLPQTRALLSSAWLVGLVLVWSRWTQSVAGGWLLLLTAGAALLPTLLDAHASHEQSHALGVTSLVVHVGAVCVWLGGLLALALHVRPSVPALARALPRYSRAALGCFLLVALTGVLTASTLLDRLDQLWTTAYGQLLLAKAVGLLLLGGCGHRHRRRTLPAVAEGRPRAFLALAAAELVLMAATAALAVALSQTPPPPSTDHGAGAVQAHPTSPG